MAEIELFYLAHSRTGDKGDSQTMSLIPYRPEDYALIARQITADSPIPTIGIGAGPHCDGQVAVFHDLFGLYPDRSFRHVRRYAEAGAAIQAGAERFVEEVRRGEFPGAEQSF